MLKLILAFQAALQGLIGSAGFDGSGCPLPNSVNFNNSGWNVTISLGEGSTTGQGCPVTIDLDMRGSCIKQSDVAKIAGQVFHPAMTDNSTAQVWVDDQPLRMIDSEEADSEEDNQNGRFCGDSVVIHLERELDFSNMDQNLDQMAQNGDEVIRRQALAPIERQPINSITAPRLCPCPRPPTPAPTFQWRPWPPRPLAPSFQWTEPQWPWPQPWPPRPYSGVIWQESAPDSHDDDSNRLQPNLPLAQRPFPRLCPCTRAPTPAPTFQWRPRPPRPLPPTFQWTNPQWPWPQPWPPRPDPGPNWLEQQGPYDRG